MKQLCHLRTSAIWPITRNLLLFGVSLAVSLSTSSSAFATSPGPSYYNTPKKFYVSKNGDNTDGLSWATAWNEMDQIQWQTINPQRHDSLIIDGGTRRMIYRKPMHVQVQEYPSPVSITLSTEAGHSGQAVIAPGRNNDGITISSGGIQLTSSKRSGFYVYGAKNGVKVITTASYPLRVKNIEISNCAESGLYVGQSHYPVPIEQFIIHDNATNVVAKQGSTPGGARLTRCWIYNRTYRKDSDGVRVDGTTTSAPMPGVTLNDCVVGPGLRDGINNLTTARPTLKNCLFINATRNNISSYSVSLENVTSFMTRLNPRNSSHSGIKLQASPQPYNMISSIVKKTIVYGGMVEILLTVSYPYPPYTTQPFPMNVEGNTQFRTTGNTTALSNTMVNPKFVSRIGRLPNRTPIPILMSLDFSLRPNSAATGTGSSVTSVRNLLSSFN